MIKNLSIRRKLFSAFGAIIVVLLILSTIFYFNFSRVSQANKWNVHTYQVIDESRALAESMANMETGLRGFALTGNENMLEPYHDGLKAFHSQLTQAKALTSDNPAQQTRLDNLQRQQAEWLSSFAKPLMEKRRAVGAGQMTSAVFFASFDANTGKAQMDSIRVTIAGIIDTEKLLLKERERFVADTQSKTRMALILGALTGIAIAIILSYIIAGAISNPIRQSVHVAELIAKGDLTSELVADSDDETGKLLRSLDVMQNQLRMLVTEIQSSSASVDLAAQEVATGNTDLSSRTEEQAASLEETSASMEQLTATVRQNTQNAQSASALATSASEIAQRGGEVVDQVVTKMSAISESSMHVVEIIATIEDIAFQTNILALNAAVESARAGEQGRGFAVVASEVRALAQRSGVAAKEIKELLHTSSERVAEGAKLVEETGVTMDEIVASIQKVSDFMAEISSSSIEQVRGIEHVGLAIEQIDEVTQQNAALVEQAASAAASLQDQAARLARVVSVFIVDRGVHRPAAQLPPAV